MKSKLDEYYQILEDKILASQSATTGLIGDGKVGGVRDTTYSAAALWVLSVGYRDIDADDGNQYVLEQSAVKCMRGILSCFMRQSLTLEKYKINPCPENALRINLNFTTGEPLPEKTSHILYTRQQLQLDIIATYLVFLCEMIASGLEIIFSLQEVSFVQNLVYYIERAYRVPDFGMWGRGSKHNCGKPELSSSSVGAVNSALFAIDGFNLYGKQGASWSVIYVDQDAFCRNQRTLEALLPRESNSKYTDASLIPTLGWPCFSSNLTDGKTKQAFSRILQSLCRSQGFIRFNKDGFGTIIEDPDRDHYLPAELKKFDGIESEWPVFFAFLLIDAKFKNNKDDVIAYRKKLTDNMYPDVELNTPLNRIPTFHQLNNRRAGLRKKAVYLPNFQWVDAVAYIALILADDLIQASEIDPRRLFEKSTVSAKPEKITERTIQISLISENAELQTFLSSYGVQTETPSQTEPIIIWPSQELVKVYSTMGVDTKLGLTGRPPRPIGVNGSSRVYRIFGRTIVAYPLVFDVADFYISSDTDSLIDNVWFSLDYLKKYFDPQHQPVFLFILRDELCRGSRLIPLLEVLSCFRRGAWRDVKVRLGRLQSFVANSVSINLSFVRERMVNKITFEKGFFQRSISYTSLDSVNHNISSTEDNFEFDAKILEEITSCYDVNHLIDLYLDSTSYVEKTHILIKLQKMRGNDFKVGQNAVGDKLNNILRQFTKQKDWVNVRLVASHCNKLVDSLAPSVTSILCEGKQLSIGVFGHQEVAISSPLSPAEILNILYSYVFTVNPSEAVLQQEIILTIGQRIIVTQPHLLDQILHIRIGWLIEAMRLELSLSNEGKNIFELSPSEVLVLLENILSKSDKSLDVYQSRRLKGALNKAPTDFYQHVWLLLERSNEGIKIAGKLIPAEPTLSDMDATDMGFKLLIEKTLQHIKVPEHRHLVIETVIIISTVLKRNPELLFNTLADIDLIIKEGIEDYSCNKNNTNNFYSLESAKLVKYISHSVIKTLLLSGEIQLSEGKNCEIS